VSVFRFQVRRRYRDCRIIDLACCNDLNDSFTDRLESWMDNTLLSGIKFNVKA
jgi:hypothetical protein